MTQTLWRFFKPSVRWIYTYDDDLKLNVDEKLKTALFEHYVQELLSFPFVSLILLTTAGVKCMCGGCKLSPRTSSLCSSPQGSCIVCCLHLKMEFRSCARGRQWCGIIHYYWWTASIKPRLLFSRAGFASWGLSRSSVNFNKTEAAIFPCRLCFLRAFPSSV